MSAIITGIGHYVPNRKLTNKDIAQMVDTSDEWITTRTGIKERRILDNDKGTSYMAAKAAKIVLEQKNISSDEIDLIIVATITPDMLFPATAALVQKELHTKKGWGFDLNGACTGFVYALATASQFIETGKYNKIMVIGADKMSAIIDYEDRNTCPIFGDGAGAVLLESSNDNDLGIEDFLLHLDGSGYKYLGMPAGGSLMPASYETVKGKKHYLYQEGKKVFKCAVNGMTEVATRLMKKNGLTAKDIKLLIPHQANLRIIDAVANKMEFNKDQVMINIDKYGNTTAGTIPIAMSEAYEKKMMRKGDWILLSTFGAGFTWGSLLLRWAID